MNNLSLSAKIGAIVAGLIVVSIGIGVFGLINLDKMNQRLQSIVNLSAEKVKIGARVNQNILQIGRAEKNILLADTQEAMDVFAKEIDAVQTDMQEHRAKLRELADDAGKAKLDEFAAKWNQYAEVHRQVRAFARLNSNVRAMKLSSNDGRLAIDKAETLMRDISAQNDLDVTAAAQAADKTVTAVKLGATLRQDLLTISRAEKNIILASSATDMSQYQQEIERTRLGMQQRLAEARKLVGSEDQLLLNELGQRADAYLAVNKQVCEIASSGSADANSQAVALAFGKGRELCDQADALARRFVDSADVKASEAIATAENAAHQSLLSAEILQELIGIHRAEKNLILETSEEGMDQYAANMAKAELRLAEMVADLEKLASAAEKVKLAEFKQDWAKFLDISQKVRTISRENGNNKGFALATGTGRQLADEAQGVMAALVEKNEADMQSDITASQASYATVRTMMLVIIGIVCSVSAMFAIVILRNLNHRINNVITSLSSGSEQVASASGQVSESSQQMAEGASEQASSLEETSASLEEMAAGTRQNADHAREADALSREANGKAEQGTGAARTTAEEVGKRLAELNKAIKAIEQSTAATAQVVETIDDIAFQTNLLALNAAVEAARAGEAGMGFAVVADEVRNLAQRSAQEVKNTNELMKSARVNAEQIKEVTAGMADYLNKAVAKEMVTLFEETVTASTKVTQLMSEVAAASDEQARGVDQINQAVAQMDQVTQSNAANAEESAAASEELSSQAAELRRVVTQLRRIIHGDSTSVDDDATEYVRPETRPSARPQTSAPATRRQLGAPASAGNAQTRKPAARGRTVIKSEHILPLTDSEENSYAEHQGDFSKF